MTKPLEDVCITAEESDTLEIAYSKGMVACEQAHPRDRNPYPNQSTLFQWWDSGWCQQVDELCGN